MEKDIDFLRYAARTYGVIKAWCSSGLFDALLDRQAHAIDTLPGDSRAVRQSASLLAHMGLLVIHGDTVALSRCGHELYTGGAMNLGSSEAALGDYSRLDAVISGGGPAHDKDGNSRVTEGGVREHNPQNARKFMDMLYRRSEHSAVETSRWIKTVLPDGGQLLDLGGGHGRYGDALTNAGFTVTLYDRPVCVEIAQERYGAKLNTLTGDFMNDDLGGPYNVALLSNIVHGLGPQENLRLLTRLHGAMAPGGVIVIKDMFIGEHRSDPEEAVFFDLTMLMYTREGRSYPLDEMRSLCRDAGFSDHDHVYLKDHRFSLLSAIK